MKIHINSFVKRQTPESEFSHYAPRVDDTWRFLCVCVWTVMEMAERAGGDEELVSQGYRDGVVLVHLSPEDFFSGVVTLAEGSELCGSFKARRDGEEPRKSIYVLGPEKSAYDQFRAHSTKSGHDDYDSYDDYECRCRICDVVFTSGRVPGEKMPAKSVDIVLYASTVLAEGGDNELPAEEGNWEIISINANPCEGEMPINPDVLMHNHFGSDGGTATGLSDEDFVKMLRESFLFWKDKAMVAPKKE